jgi:putative Holliday junction resolvase
VRGAADNNGFMRVLGVDFGQRRIGLALSDASAVLASPWKTAAAGPTPKASARMVAALVEGLADEDVRCIIVGIPRRLNGEDNEQTKPAREFAAALREAAGLPVVEQDERLSSHEADQRLAVRERDWRRRKEKLDAAAAAVILQDYLDQAGEQASKRAGEGEP